MIKNWYALNLFAKASHQFVQCPIGVWKSAGVERWKESWPHKKLACDWMDRAWKDNQQLKTKSASKKPSAAVSFCLQIMINSLQCDLAKGGSANRNSQFLHTMAIIHSSTCRTRIACISTQFRRPCKIRLWKLNFHNVDRHIEFTDKSWIFHACIVSAMADAGIQKLTCSSAQTP